MEGLAGDLGTMSVPDLILFLGNKGATGTLVVEQGNVKKSVSIENGMVVNAASNDPREYLGQFLINFGHITEDQLTKAFKTQAETKVFLGRILVMIGLVNEEVLKQVLTIKLRETTLSLCRWTEGSFRFARGVLPPDQEGVKVQVPLIDVHREAEFRDTAWQAMLQVFPSGNMTLKVDESKAPADLTTLDGQLFALMREGYVIDEISLRLHATDFHLYQRLYALYRQGAITPLPPEPKVEVDIEVADEPEDDKVGEVVSTAEILIAARKALADKRFADAEALAVRAAELSPTTEAQALVRDAETALLAELRRTLLGKPQIPRLSASNLNLKDLDLSPQAKYLLSRIDGKRDVGAIIRVSPVRELDALRFFQGFVDDGLITLSE